MSDLQAYLAAKYMTGAKADAILDRAADSTAGGKRRKKKRPTNGETELGEGGFASGSGSRRKEGQSGMIVEDDDGGWGRAEIVEDDEARPGSSLAQYDQHRLILRGRFSGRREERSFQA